MVAWPTKGMCEPIISEGLGIRLHGLDGEPFLYQFSMRSGNSIAVSRQHAAGSECRGGRNSAVGLDSPPSGLAGRKGGRRKSVLTAHSLSVFFGAEIPGHLVC